MSDYTLTIDEYHELEDLVEQGQRLTLRITAAMKRLLQRGYSITLDDLALERRNVYPMKSRN